MLTVNVAGELVPPPSAGLVTVTPNAPAVSSAVDGTVAVIVVAVCVKIVTAVVPTLADEFATKLVPVIVIVNAAAPLRQLDGEIADTVGTGLFTLTENAVLTPPPGVGFVAVILSVPCAAKLAAGIVTVRVPS